MKHDKNTHHTNEDGQDDEKAEHGATYDDTYQQAHTHLVLPIRLLTIHQAVAIATFPFACFAATVMDSINIGGFAISANVCIIMIYRFKHNNLRYV